MASNGCSFPILDELLMMRVASNHVCGMCWGNKSDPAEVAFQKHHGVTIMEAIKTGAACMVPCERKSNRS